ncbi:MAG: protein kinase [Polyangiaceae bacterium]
MPDPSLIDLTLGGRFRITGVIGEGGMATVYRGIVDGSANEVAIKIMNPDLAKENRFVRRFKREAKAASMLKHPNTVQILEFGLDQGFVFLAMELLRGFDLAMLLHRERRVTEVRAVQIVVQVCYALAAAHQQSIIHRDLKPDNIMLVKLPGPGAYGYPNGVPLPLPGMSPNDFVKVLDFGIAKILDDDAEKGNFDPRAEPTTQQKSMLTRVGTIVGTPAYMAPEQGRAEAVDARTDLYAVGVLLYELITGRVPFTGETPMQVVMKHVNEIPRPPSDFVAIHPELNQLIMRALAKDPNQRQQTAEEMAFELLRVLPMLQRPPAAKEPEEGGLNRTLVLENGPQPGPQIPAAQPLPAPRPAAGIPAPRPAAGMPARAPAPAPAPIAAAGAMQVPAGGNPFPTLNIEVPDDIFPAGLGAPAPAPAPAPRAPLPAAGRPAADAPIPTRRLDAPAGPAPADKAAARPLPAAGKPVAPAARPQPVHRAPANAGLDQTMQSEVEDVPPPPSTDEDEEVATVVKAPNEVDKARMSLAEEAMARALTGKNPLGAIPPPPAAPALGDALPKFSGPESVEPTLVAAAGADAPEGVGKPPADGARAKAPAPAMALDRTAISDAPPAPAVEIRVDVPATPVPANPSLKGLDATVPLEPEAVERMMKEATRARAEKAAPKQDAAVAATLTSAFDGSDPEPPRKPTGELLPVNLESPAAPAPVADEKPAEAPLVWQPKGKRIGGTRALLLGIAIGALLVIVVIGVFLLLGKRGG